MKPYGRTDTHAFVFFALYPVLKKPSPMSNAHSQWAGIALAKTKINLLISQAGSYLKRLARSEDTKPPISAKVVPWCYGAEVRYADSKGVDQVEYFSLPPVVGRFDTATYNEIVRLINLNADQLKSPNS